MPTILSLGFVHNRKDQDLQKGNGLTPPQAPISIPNLEAVIPDNSIPYDKTSIDTLLVNQYVKGGATGYDAGTGFWLGNDGSAYKFFIGDSAGDKMTWDGSTLTITGSLVAGSIHIPDLDTTDSSFHVDTTGNMWIGATQSDFTSSNENAEVYFLANGSGFLKSNLQVGLTAGDNIAIDGGNLRIRSSNYVSGALGAGFTLEPDLLEVGNISARGKFQTANFVTNNISAVSGDIVVVIGSDVLDTDMTALDASTLTISGDVTFAVNDVIRIKSGADDEWMTVTNTGSAPTYVVTRDEGAGYAADSNPAWQKGTAVVNFGPSGQGGVFITANDTNAPFVSIFEHAGSPWSTITTHLRLGNLNGFLDYVADAYGIGVGVTNDSLTYDTTNGLRVSGTVTVKAGSTLNTMPSDENLAAYWSFDEQAGSTAIDETNNGNNGVITGATYDTGVSGTALHFDAGPEVVTVSAESAIDNLFATGGTVSCWVNIDSDGGLHSGRILQKAPNGLLNGWVLYTGSETVDGVRLNFFVNFDGGGNSRGRWVSDTNTRYPLNEWVHVAVTYDGSSTSNVPIFYLNGVALGNLTINETPSGAIEDDSSRDLYIGNDIDQTNEFDGHLDEIRLYDSVLTALEIYTLYQHPGGVSPQGVKQLGGKYTTAPSGARVQLFPDSNTGLLAEDSGGNNVLEVIVGGSDVGDVILGEEASGEYAKWDDSAAEFLINGQKAATIKDRANTLFEEFFFKGNSQDGFTETPGTGSITRTFITTELDSGATSSCSISGDATIDAASSFEFGVAMKMESISNIDGFIGIENWGSLNIANNGVETAKHIGFYVVEGVLYASNANNTTQTTTNISAGLTLTDYNVYRLEYTASTDVKFYVNETLVATHTTNLPAAAMGIPYLGVESQVGTQMMILYNNYYIKILL